MTIDKITLKIKLNTEGRPNSIQTPYTYSSFGDFRIQDGCIYTVANKEYSSYTIWSNVRLEIVIDEGLTSLTETDFNPTFFNTAEDIIQIWKAKKLDKEIKTS
jgi:hypothetical protein